jgi:hypothetical protein
MASRRALWLLLALSACTPAMDEDPQVGGGSGPGTPSAAAPSPAGPLVLTWPAPAGAVYQAVGTEGTLEQDGRCLYLRSSASHRFLLVFPEGTSWDAAAGGLRFGDQLLRLGTRVALSGLSPSAPAGVAPGFDPQGCDTREIFRVNPWRAG